MTRYKCGKKIRENETTKGELHELPNTEIVKFWTIRLAEFVLSNSLTFFEDSFIARN